MDNKVAVDGRYFCSMHRSLALYTGSLLKALVDMQPTHRPVVLLPGNLHPIAESIREDLGEQVTWIGPPSPIRHIGRLVPELRWVHYALPRLMRALSPEPDLLIMPYHHPPWRAGNATRVVVIHDLCGLGIGFPKHKKNYWRHYLRLRAAAHLADSIWPISLSTRDAMARRFPASRRRMGPVVYNGLDKAPLPAAAVHTVLEHHGLEQRGYVVAFATWQERKNFAATLGALSQLRVQAEPMRLVGIAPSRREQQGIEELCRTHGLEDAIILSDVTDEELDALYAGALALLWPSTCEGFGYPVLEAMAQGCPPLVWAVGPGAELVEGALEPLASLDPVTIAGKITELRRTAANNRADLEESLRARAKHLSAGAYRDQLAHAIEAATKHR